MRSEVRRLPQPLHVGRDQDGLLPHEACQGKKSAYVERDMRGYVTKIHATYFMKSRILEVAESSTERGGSGGGRGSHHEEHNLNLNLPTEDELR